MLKREAREILGLDEEPDVRVVSEHTYDICEFLLDLHERGELRTDFAPVDERVAYHAPCQQQGHNIGKPALDLFALVPGLAIGRDATRRCCGIAGTYGLKEEKCQISLDVGADLFAQVARRPTRARRVRQPRRAAGTSRRRRGSPTSIPSRSSTAPTGSE